MASRLTVASLAFLAFGCQGDLASGPGGTMADSAGVRMWSISGEETPSDLSLERVTGLALPDTGWVARPDGIAVDPATRTIYVLDESAPRVLVFGFDGQLQREVGRKGEGPGEYLSPNALSVTPAGDLVVLDPGLGVVHRWSRSGEYVDRTNISPGYWGPGFAATQEGVLYTTASGSETGTMIEALVSVSESSVDTLATVRSYWSPLVMPCGRVPVPEVFSLSAVWAAKGDQVVIADVPNYHLSLQGPDGRTAVFSRDLPPRHVSAEEAESFAARGPLRFLVEACGMTAAGVVRDAGLVPKVSPIFLLTIDPSNRIWAARGPIPTIDAIDIFDAETGFLGSIASPAFPAAFLDDSRYVTIIETDAGSVLEIWRVVE